MSEDTIQHNHDNNIAAEKAKEHQDNVSESYSERAKEEYMKGVERARAVAQPFLEKVEEIPQETCEEIPQETCEEKDAGLSSATVHIPSIGGEMQIIGHTYKVYGIEVTKTTATIKLNKLSNLMFR